MDTKIHKIISYGVKAIIVRDPDNCEKICVVAIVRDLDNCEKIYVVTISTTHYARYPTMSITDTALYWEVLYQEAKYIVRHTTKDYTIMQY